MRVNLRDIGFTDRVDSSEVCDRAQRLGLTICTPEIVFQICLQYREQKLDEVIRILTTPLDLSKGRQLFRIGHDGNGSYYAEDASVVVTPSH